MQAVVDEHIIAEIKRKDRDAFEYLYRNYFQKMVLFAGSYLYDEHDAADVVQDVFFKLWDRADTLVLTTSVKSYLFSAVHNRCLNVLRDRNIRDKHNEKYWEALLFSGMEDVGIDEEMQRKLESAVRGLPDKCREILLMKIVQGKKNKEISDELQLAETTVKTQIQRAYKYLRNEMIPVLLFIAWFDHGSG